MSRTVIQTHRRGLARFALFGAVSAAIWLWLGIFALSVREPLASLLIFPVALVLALSGAWIGLWALRRRSNTEPAMILDDAGIYDNVSIAGAGRVKWPEAHEIWLAGPKWCEFLCILPENVKIYVDSHQGVQGSLMRINQALFGAPVVVPATCLDIPSDDLWFRVKRLRGKPPIAQPFDSRRPIHR